MADPHGQAICARISGHDGRRSDVVVPKHFPELSLALIPGTENSNDGWKRYARRGESAHAAISIRGEEIHIDRSLPWQRFITYYFLDHVLSWQRDYFFFHGAALHIAGHGVMICGEKEAGKSTLSLALASRNHGFLGDEFATIHSQSGEMLPFRTAVSIRNGPQAEAVNQKLTTVAVDRYVLPDGSERTRMPISRLFDAPANKKVRLQYAFFIERREQQPRCTRIQFSWNHLRHIQLLNPELGNMSRETRTIRLLSLFGRTNCYMLITGGTPDDTATLIEEVVNRND